MESGSTGEGQGGIAEVVVDVAAHHRGVRGPGLDVAEQTHEVVHVSNHPEGTRGGGSSG